MWGENRSRVWSAVALMTLMFNVGCSNNDTPTDPPIPQSKEQISFSVLPAWDNTAPLTRGIITNDFTPGDSFGIHAYYLSDGTWSSAKNTPDYMSNQEVVLQQNNTWSYEPTCYWPASGNVSFFAYFPYVASTSVSPGTEGYPSLTFTPATVVDDQIDFMTAGATNRNASNSSEGVEFTFSHQLTQIKFSAAHDCGTDAVVKILSISLSTKTQATGAYTSSGGFAWGNYDRTLDDTNYTITQKDGHLSDIAIAEYDAAATAPYTDLMESSSSAGVMMIPKNLIGESPAISVTFSYQSTTSALSILNQEFTFDNSSGLTPGGAARFRFVISINEDELTHVSFGEMSAEQWEEYSFEGGNNFVI